MKKKQFQNRKRTTLNKQVILMPVWTKLKAQQRKKKKLTILASPCRGKIIKIPETKNTIMI
jgi:hypothetical protein